MVRGELIKYIDGKERLGIDYDWHKIMSEVKKLKIPSDCFNPLTAPITKADILCYVSKRSKGKTTNWLLVGMVMYLMYGTATCYIRLDKDKIKPSVVNEIFNVIKTYGNGKYIRDLTGGTYNGIYYHWGKCYLCRYDDTGKREEVDVNPFFYFLSVDKAIDYKSGLNIPKGDLIILDEFIEESGRFSDFPKFWDLFRTIQRDRLSPKIIMLANTTDPNNIWFRELCIARGVKDISPGNNKLFDVNGTKIYFEYLYFEVTKNVLRMITKYFGFAKGNPRMAHLVDTEAAWTFEPVPHIVTDEHDNYIDRTFRIEANELEMLQVELVEKPDGLICVYCHPSTEVYDDTVILTLDEIRDNSRLWGFGYGKYCDLIWKLYQRNLWYFSDNETGALVAAYVKNCRQLKK